MYWVNKNKDFPDVIYEMVPKMMKDSVPTNQDHMMLAPACTVFMIMNRCVVEQHQA